MRPPGWFRIVRAGGFALVCIGLSRAGHDLMAPHPAPAWSVGVAFGLLTLVGYRLAGRERSTRWILAAVEAVQLYLHVWFAWTSPAGALPGGTGAHAAHLMTQGLDGPVAVAHDGMSTPAMLAAHALAGALVALWLSAGERMLWRALGSLVFALSSRLGGILALLVPAAVPDHPAVAHADRHGDAPAVAMLRHAVVRRGPPRGALLPTPA